MAGTYRTEDEVETQEPNRLKPGVVGTFVGHLPHCFEDRDPAKFKERGHASKNTQGNKTGKESADDGVVTGEK